MHYWRAKIQQDSIKLVTFFIDPSTHIDQSSFLESIKFETDFLAVVFLGNLISGGPHDSDSYTHDSCRKVSPTRLHFVFFLMIWYQGSYGMVRHTSNIVPNLNKKWGLNFEGPCGASEWRFHSIKK